MYRIKNPIWTAVGTLALAALVLAPAASADQVILDDLIVDGSICAGLDCVNGESFGFDTLRLKENNLRIRFFDTSSSASFPTRDWQITANDSSNGGLEKFSIDDIDGGRIPFLIEAGARTNALYVEADGDIGIGTNNPVGDVHIVTGNTPTLRLEQDGSSGFTAQTWDVAGNEANFFIRDATNGSTLPIRLRPGAPSSAIDIAGGGNVGINDSSPDARLDVVSSSNPVAQFENSGGAARVTVINNNGTEWRLTNSSADTFRITEQGNANVELELDGNGNMTLFGTLTITGGCTGCDAVFSPEWELESIEEHAAEMWKNSYLPAVGPTPEGRSSIDVFQKTTGILQELEKAHIYIEQLHGSIKSLEERLAALESPQE